jgi:hypothetical protein
LGGIEGRCFIPKFNLKPVRLATDGKLDGACLMLVAMPDDVRDGFVYGQDDIANRLLVTGEGGGYFFHELPDLYQLFQMGCYLQASNGLSHIDPMLTWNWRRCIA